jgi:hypothetical protein
VTPTVGDLLLGLEYPKAFAEAFASARNGCARRESYWRGFDDDFWLV